MGTETVRLSALITPGNFPADGAVATIFRMDEVTPVAGGKTSNTGEVTLVVPGPGTYRVTVERVRTLFHPTTLDVLDTASEGVTDFTLFGVATLTNDSDPVRRCVVYGYVAGLRGLARQDVRISASILSCVQVEAGGTGVDARQIMVGGDDVTTRSDHNGYWEIALPIGAVVTIRVGHSSHKTMRIPDAAMVSWTDARQVVGPLSNT